ncbi:MAG: DNA polymerase ligase N-terminal domain-containing protein [Mycobacterium sp.]|nr:DNA polymerase ligase N-terminal domain-containing protein [Mycobacterium sp.]
MPLSAYRRKRRTRGADRRAGDGGPCFIIQNRPTGSGHHYDLRLEIDGVLVSWAIPKDASAKPTVKRLARRTEDHALDEATAAALADEHSGAVVVDRGTYTNATGHDMGECLRRGHLSFRLHGEKLRGGYALTRIRAGECETWLLMKRKDTPGGAQHEPESMPLPR